MCLAQGPQRSDAGEARTRGLSVSSQALYDWATAFPRFDQALNRLPMSYKMVTRIIYTDVKKKCLI